MMAGDAGTTGRYGVFATRQRVHSDLAFVIMPFASALDDIYDIVRQAATDAGYQCLRADEDAAPGRITDTIYQGIHDAAVVVVDLTGRNPNVFYELGLAHAISDNVVLITQDIEDVPFDVAHFRVIPYVNSIGGGSQLSRDLSGAMGTIGPSLQPSTKPGTASGLSDQPTFALVMMLDVAVNGGDEQLAQEALRLLLQRRESGETFDADQMATMAVCAELLGETETARELFEDARAKYPDDENVILSQASFLLDLEHSSQADLVLAAELLDGTFENRPREMFLRSQLAIATETDANPIVDEMVTSYVRDPQAIPVPVLTILGELQRLDDARTVIDSWVEVNPEERWRGQSFLAELLRNSDDEEHNAESAEIYRSLIEHGAYSDPALQAGDMISLAALIGAVSGSTDEALDLARGAYALAPDDPLVRSVTAQLLAAADEHEPANLVLHGQPLPD